jgi:hypothetical protein
MIPGNRCAELHYRRGWCVLHRRNEGCATAVNGSAEISYFTDGVWGVESISLEGYRASTATEIANGAGKFVRKHVTLDAGTPLHLMVVHRLEHEWQDAVQDAVNAKIDEDRASAPDNRADRLRDARAA